MDPLLEAARDLAAQAAAAPHALARRVKQTLATVATVESHEAAVDVELEAQVWSLAQPEFKERLAAMQKQISTKR